MIRLNTKHLTIKLIFPLLFPQLLLKELRKEWSSLNGQSASSTRGKTRFPTPSVWTLIAEAVISVVMLKYGNHRSWQWRGWKQKKNITQKGTWAVTLQEMCYMHMMQAAGVWNATLLTSICLFLKTELMLELKEAPENMEVTGYVRSKIFLKYEVIPWRRKF